MNPTRDLPNGQPEESWPELRDPFVGAAAALWAVCSALVWWRPFDAADDRLFASEIAFALLAAAVVVAAVARLVRERGRSARWTYGSLAAAFSIWLAIELLEIAYHRALGPRFDLATDLLYLVAYSLVLLAAETAAGRSVAGRTAFHVQIELLATILFVGALLTYFLLLPYNLDASNRLRSVSWWSYYALFDVLLLVRLVPLARGLPAGSRRRLLGWLAGAAGFLLAADLSEAIWRARGGGGISPPPFFELYYTALLAAAVSARVPLERARATGEVTLAGVDPGLALPRFSPVLAYVVALPLGHLLVETLDPTPESFRAARELLVIATTGVLGALAAWSWSSFRREHLRLLQASERATEALARSRHLEAVGRLAAGVAHDFNNRLTVILGFASRLRGRSGDDAAREQAVAAIAEAADQASRLTMELLAVGRAQAARVEPLDLAGLADELASEARQLAAPGIEVQLHREAVSLPIEVDRMHLLRIVWNLAANASDAMPDGGTVDVIVGAREIRSARDAAGELVPAGDYALLAVRDRGVGMTAETIGRLFDPFFTTKEFGRGSGLGLAAVLGLIRSNGAYVLVESAPGAGSRFEVLFPLRA